MAVESTTAPPKQVTRKKDKLPWYDWAIDIFKKILEFNYSTYGTKKKF